VEVIKEEFKFYKFGQFKTILKFVGFVLHYGSK